MARPARAMTTPARTATIAQTSTITTVGDIFFLPKNRSESNMMLQKKEGEREKKIGDKEGVTKIEREEEETHLAHEMLHYSAVLPAVLPTSQHPGHPSYPSQPLLEPARPVRTEYKLKMQFPTSVHGVQVRKWMC